MNKSTKLLDIVEQEYPHTVKNNPNGSRYSTVARYAMLLTLGATGAIASGCMGPIGSFKTMVVARDVRIVSKPGDIEDYDRKRKEYTSKLEDIAQNNRFELEGGVNSTISQPNNKVNDVLLYSLAEDIKENMDVKGSRERYSLSQLQTIYERLIGLKIYYEEGSGKKEKYRNEELKDINEYIEVLKLKLAQKHITYAWYQTDQQKKSAHILAAMILTLENNSTAVNEFVEMRELRRELRPSSSNELYNKDKFDEIIAIPYPVETCIAKRIHGLNTGLTGLYMALMSTSTFAGLMSIGGEGIAPILNPENPILPISQRNIQNDNYPLERHQHDVYQERFYPRGYRT